MTSDFSKGKLFPMILKYSIPAAVSLLITAIYNIVDRIFVGNYNGTSALAGLSICFPLSYLMIAFGLTCSAGGSSLFSLFAGRKEQKQMNRSFGNALILAVVSELILTVLLLVWMDPVLRIFGVTQTAYAYAADYYRIVALGFVMLATTFFQSIAKPAPSIVLTVFRQILFLIPFLYVLPAVWQVQGIFAAQPVSDLIAVVIAAVLILREQKRLLHGDCNDL